MENGLKGIGKRAFYDNNIQKIYMNNSIYYIGEEAFYRGFHLKTINNIPRNLQVIEDDVFYSENLDEETIEIIEKINPRALYTSTSGAWMSAIHSYDYDMKYTPISNTAYSNTNDSEYDVYIPSPGVGDYVNYIPNSKSLTVFSGSSGTKDSQDITTNKKLKWRVFNIDYTNEKVDLISDRPTDETLSLFAYKGYNNAVYLMNKICSYLYRNSKYSSTARSINLEDVEKLLTQNGVNARNNYVSDAQIKYGSVKYYGYIGYPVLYKKQKGNGVATGDIYTPKLVQKNPDPYEESDMLISRFENWEDDYTFSGSVTQTAYKLPINGNYFKDKAFLIYSSTPYFIAARCTDTQNDLPKYGVRRASSSIEFVNIYETMERCAWEYLEDATSHLRPIVTIDLDLFTNQSSNGSWNLAYKDAGSSGEYSEGPFKSYDDCIIDYSD